MNKKPIILFCGLMGSGKTTLSKYYLEKLFDYTRFNTDEIRRILGFTHFDLKDTPKVNDYMYSRARNLLKEGRGVMFDSAYKLKEAREKIYSIGKELGAPILVIECFCSPEIAVKRISSREGNDGLHKPTNNPEVYYEYSKIWESPEIDLNNEGNEHVSFIRIDTETKNMEEINIKEDNSIKELVDFLKKELSLIDYSN